MNAATCVDDFSWRTLHMRTVVAPISDADCAASFERRLTFQPRQGGPQDVLVRIDRPVLDESAPHETWICPFQIEGIGSGKTRGMFGADTMQALLLAIHTIPVELAVCIRDSGGQLLHFGEPDASFVTACRIAIEYAGDEFPPRQG